MVCLLLITVIMKPLKNIPSADKEVLPEPGGAGEDKSGVIKAPASFYEEVLMNIPADIAVYNTKGEYLFQGMAYWKRH
jgi:hypothetical protein